MNRLEQLKQSAISKRILLSICGITFNVIMAYIMYKSHAPLYMDTIGTMAVAAMGGLFPGILTAVVSNAICALFNVQAIYFGFINAFIAIMISWFTVRFSLKSLWRVSLFILVLGFISGGISAFISWFLLNGKAIAGDTDSVVLFASLMKLPTIWAYFFYHTLLNMIDKGLALFFTWLLLLFVPRSFLEDIEKGNWRQRPLQKEEIKALNQWGKDLKHSMSIRTTLIIMATSFLLVAVTGWSGIRLYFAKSKEEKTNDAQNALNLVSQLIDPKELNSFIANGNSAPGHEEVERLLQKIIDNYDNVEALYLVKFRENNGYMLFDLDRSDGMKHNKRTVFEYDDRIAPYLQRLLQGENIEPIEHGDMNSWMRSVYYPIKDEKGNTICYAIADISVTYVADYMEDFIVRSCLILFGFFILVIASNMWYTNVLMVYPIRSMAKFVDDFSNLGYGQEQLDQNVKNIRALQIKTEDEVEKLYKSICKMTLNISEQMRDLRRLSEATAKMQDGLIITMADMVERRDSDTGEHIQKTALYVKIIVEGLQKKGYYAGKITPKFISDVVRSAPLHDIGKINIPDGILNKPGKLTPEEYEIMKTHTTAGKKIMEDAISTVEGENYLKEARNMAAYHHERWDGKGYPEGLHGEVIPLSARIMAVADVFDALTSPRVYKPAFPLDEALAIISEESGKAFDPKCVEVFMESLPEVKVILKKYNNM